MILGFCKKLYPPTHIKIRSETVTANSLVDTAVTFLAHQALVVNVAKLIDLIFISKVELYTFSPNQPILNDVKFSGHINVTFYTRIQTYTYTNMAILQKY
jgi:hypothetical protein